MAPTTKKTIAIIGAGPAGLAALKCTLDTPQYKEGLWTPVVLEARDDVGGVWVPADPTSSTPEHPPETPLYDSLTTNLPHPLMAYSGFPFPASTPIFPKADHVRRYLSAYADTFKLQPFIRLNTRVTHVDYVTEPSEPSFEPQWTIQTSNSNGETETISADLLIVCNGHYASPRFPNTAGVREWIDAGLASHSMWYRHPPAPPTPNSSSAEVNILVVGAGPSGQDLCADFLALTHQSDGHQTRYTIIHSTTDSVIEDVPYPTGNTLKRRGRVASYHPLTSSLSSPASQTTLGTVTFESGETISDIHHVYLATGYDYAYPFFPRRILERGTPPAPSHEDWILPNKLWNSGFSIGHLVKHVWPLCGHSGNPNPSPPYPPTSLAFLGLLSRVSPLPLVEVQAQAVLSAFASPNLLDLRKERQDVLLRYEALQAQERRQGDDEKNLNERVWKEWHKFEPMDQYDYRELMHTTFVVPGTTHAVHGGRASSTVPDWHREMYNYKGLLRTTWRQLEKDGEADEFVRGVGAAGDPEGEWEECMRRLLKRGLGEGMQGCSAKTAGVDGRCIIA